MGGRAGEWVAGWVSTVLVHEYNESLPSFGAGGREGLPPNEALHTPGKRACTRLPWGSAWAAGGYTSISFICHLIFVLRHSFVPDVASVAGQKSYPLRPYGSCHPGVHAMPSVWQTRKSSPHVH